MTWTPPVDDGGAAIAGYTATVYADGVVQGTRSAGANATSIQVGNLRTDPAIAYTFRVAARNKAGTGAASGLMGPVSFPVPGQQPRSSSRRWSSRRWSSRRSSSRRSSSRRSSSRRPSRAITLDGTPRLVGAATVGAKLRVRVPKVTTPGKAKVKYIWKVGGKRVKHATGKTYRIVASDRGKRIKVVLKIRQPGLKAIRVTTKPVKVRR